MLVGAITIASGLSSPVSAQPKPGATAVTPAPPAALVPKEEPPPEAVPVRLVPRIVRPDLVWNPRWRRFSTAELVGTGIIAAGALPFAVIPSLGDSLNSRSGFDEAARGALRLDTVRARNTARDVSDLLLTVSITYPFFVDALAAAYLKRSSPDVAAQMVQMDLEALAVNAFLSSMVSNLTGRERPYGRLCAVDPVKQSFDCSSTSRDRSFFSGHSSTAFASAGLVCSHHLHFDLFGGGAPETLACITALLAAGTTASLRVLADQHYLSDILVGSSIGAAMGFGLPWLLHYRNSGSILPGSSGARRGAVTWTLAPGPLGGALFGTF